MTRVTFSAIKGDRIVVHRDVDPRTLGVICAGLAKQGWSVKPGHYVTREDAHARMLAGR